MLEKTYCVPGTVLGLTLKQITSSRNNNEEEGDPHLWDAL